MDSTTEPIVAIIGHPIAGNPSQFAAERAFREMKLEWRVVSFDVDPDDIVAALDGFSAIGIAGVLIDPSVMPAASRWYRQRSAEAEHDEEEQDGAEQDEAEQDEAEHEPGPAIDAPPIDCLRRDGSRFVGSYERRSWVDQLIAGQPGDRRLVIGEFSEMLPVSRDLISDAPAPSPPDPELIEVADLIVITKNSVALETEDWPSSADQSKLVLDLSEGHPQLDHLRQLGYRVVGGLEQQVGTLQRCLKQWTESQPSNEVIHDAIEEYFGV